MSPPCPITGVPATLIQTISPALLRGLWRRAFGVEPTPLATEQGRIGLWRSPCGLAFFHPRAEGDAAFYGALYRKLDAAERVLSAAPGRPEYLAAAAHLGAEDRVLDVGCGPAAFAMHVRGRYLGLDPHPEAYARLAGEVRAESLDAHAAANPGAYDAVCAFQVIEHVADPRGFAATMLRCVRPGGLLMLGAPIWPSVMTAIPDFALNAPPHHLSWWSESAMAALAGVLGLEVVRIALLPPAPGQPLIHWMGRLAPVKTADDGPFFAARWSWYASLGAAWAAARVAARVVPFPKRAAPMFVLLVARRPGA